MERQMKILGFTIDEIDAATCYFTRFGLEKMDACTGALAIFKRKAKVTEKSIRRYKDLNPEAWLADLMFHNGSKKLAESVLYGVV